MPATRARTCTSREPSVRPTASKLTGTSLGATSITLTGTAAGADLASSFFCLASPWLQAATMTHILRASDLAKARNLGYHGAEDGDALRAQGAFAVGDGEAQQSGAHVVALELDEHALGQVARHFLEERVLAREVVVDGLLRDARAPRDVVNARSVAAGKE